MEKQGLLKKTKDPRMKNIKRVSLSKKGEQFFIKARERETPNQLLSCLCAEEKGILLACSEKIRNSALEQLTFRHIWEPLFG